MIQRKNLIIFLIVYKLFLLAIFIPLAYNLMPFYEASYLINTELSGDKMIDVPSPYTTWDSFNFLYLAKKGYSQGIDKFNVLFPLFPLSIRLFKSLFDFNIVFWGILLASIFSIVGIMYFYYFGCSHFGPEAGLASLLMLLAFPSSFYFSLIYSESLFFMLVMIFFFYAFKKNYIAAGICAFFLPLTRPAGIAVPFVFLAVYFANLKKERIKLDLLYVLFPVLGFAALLVFFYFATGNAFQWTDSQGIYLARHDIKHILNPIASLYNNFFKTRLTLHGYTSSIIDRTLFLLFIPALFFIYRQQRFSLFLYAFLTGALSAVSGNMMSYTRYICAVFPLYYFLGMNFNMKKNTLAFFMLLLIFILIQGLFITRHVNYFWVG